MDSASGCQSHCCDTAIVGGGSSGVLVAAQLLRSGYPGRIAIVETRSRLGQGLAYSTECEYHLLNVPAAGMSAFPDKPAHFVEWLRGRGWPGAAPEAFVPRKIYGEYMEDVLRTSAFAAGDRNWRHLRAEVVDLDAADHDATLALDNGVKVAATKVVLALGNPASARFAGAAVETMGERWHASPWMGDALRIRSAGERILLAGAGLTAVDSALALHGQGLDCKTIMISRRGILPHGHDPRRAPGPPPVFEEPRNVRLMFQHLRAQIQQLREADGCWRTAVDALRPVSNQIWQDLPLAEQRRFVRHLKPYWETHRHRMAPQVRRRMDELRAQGKIEVVAGRIHGSVRTGDAIEVTLAERRGGDRRIEVDRAIDCTGIHEDYNRSPRRLIRTLIEKGLACANHLGLGFRTDESGALIGADGRPSQVLFTLGPPRRGDLFETTAIPEIRCQAASLARHLLPGANQFNPPATGITWPVIQPA